MNREQKRMYWKARNIVKREVLHELRYLKKSLFATLKGKKRFFPKHSLPILRMGEERRENSFPSCEEDLRVLREAGL